MEKGSKGFWDPGTVYLVTCDLSELPCGLDQHSSLRQLSKEQGSCAVLCILSSCRPVVGASG